MLFAGRKLTADEAQDCGLVTAVFPHDKLMEEVQNRVQAMAKLPPKVIIVFRKKICSIFRLKHLFLYPAYGYHFDVFYLGFGLGK